jgi:hypothetical protein
MNRLNREIEKLEYDFKHFSLEDFVDHIARRKRREIILRSWPFSSKELSALWLPQETAHYILFNANYHQTHQIHSILHELAHLILGHSVRSVLDILDARLVQEFGGFSFIGRPRWVASRLETDQEEIEAEAFVCEIQGRVMLANRLDSLMGKGSSSEYLNRYVSSAAYDV